MKMNKDLKSLLLSGMATAFSLFQANGQDMKKPEAALKPTAPSALVLVADMTNGNEEKYHAVWSASLTNLSLHLSDRGFYVHRVGSGHDLLKLQDNPEIDSALLALSQNETDDIIYITAHGKASSRGEHRIDLGEEVTRLSQNGTRVTDKDTSSFDLVKNIVAGASEKNHTLGLIFDSCGGHKLLLEIYQNKLELPKGTKIQTFSNPEDITFSGTVASAMLRMGSSEPMKDLVELHHSYNTHLYDDTGHTNQKNKYKYGPSGSALLERNDDNSYTVMSPYKSFYDRVGKGLSEKDKTTILNNFKNFYGFKGRSYQKNKDTFSRNIDKADMIIKNATIFEHMSRKDQDFVISRLTHLNEKTPLKDYVSFMAENHMRLVAQDYSQKQSKKMRTNTPFLHGPP